jgi:hypothetical protein
MKIFYSLDFVSISIQIKKKIHDFDINVSIHLQPEKRISPAFIVSSCLQDKVYKYSELFEFIYFNYIFIFFILTYQLFYYYIN